MWLESDCQAHMSSLLYDEFKVSLCLWLTLTKHGWTKRVDFTKQCLLLRCSLTVLVSWDLLSSVWLWGTEVQHLPLLGTEESQPDPASMTYSTVQYVTHYVLLESVCCSFSILTPKSFKTFFLTCSRGQLCRSYFILFVICSWEPSLYWFPRRSMDFTAGAHSFEKLYNF